MSERKVLNKYFPPDFDPSKIPRRKIGRDVQQVVRLMAPCTMCCLTCGEFIYKGKKFNAKKETAQGEEYYGIKIFRFYIKCTRCSSEITFKTDPKNADYVIEHGATRNYEGWKEEMPNAAADDEEEDDEDDPMAALEASQAASKRQMEDEDNLADLRQRNARMARNEVDADAILAQQHALSAAEEEARRKEQEEEDEEVKRYFYKVAPPGFPGTAAAAIGNGKATSNGKGKEKEQAKMSMGGLGGYGSDDSGSDSDDEESDGGDAAPAAPAAITVKRNPGALLDAQPTVKDLLAAKGIVLGASALSKPAPSIAMKTGTAPGGVKRKDLASSLGIKIAKKKKA